MIYKILVGRPMKRSIISCVLNRIKVLAEKVWLDP